MDEKLVQVISDLLDPLPVPIRETTQFREVPHDEILNAYAYWLQYLKLLVKEPFLVEIIQGPQDDGVDLLINFLKNDHKIGIQVKSHNDIKQEKFREKVMSQVAYSRKHNITKLLVVLCADLENKSQSFKVRNLMSQFSQMGDNYVSVIQPQKALPIYQCYKNKKHPLVYLARNKQIIELIQGLSESLSTSEYDVSVSVRFDYKLDEKTKDTHPIKSTIKFKPFHKDTPDSPLDKFTRLNKLGEKVEFTKDDIEEITIYYPGGRKETIKPDYVKAVPEKNTLGPINLYVIDSDEPLVENIILYEEFRDENSVIFKTSEESFPWHIEWTGIKDKKMVNFHLEFKGEKGNFVDVLNYQKLMKSMKNNGALIIELVPMNKKEKMLIDPERIPSFSDESIQLTENLVFIQEQLAQQIPVSMDDSLYNPMQIDEFATFLREKSIEKTPVPFTLFSKKQEVTEILDEIKLKSTIEKFDFVIEQMGILLVGQNFKFGPVKITLHDIILENDPQELRSKLDNAKEDEMIEFTVKSKEKSKDVYELISK